MSRENNNNNNPDRIEVYRENGTTSNNVHGFNLQKVNKSKPGEWHDGPDNLCPSNSYSAVKLNDAIKLRVSDNDYQPLSIYTLFRNTVNEKPNYPALAFKDGSRWLSISFSEYWKSCTKAAKSFIKLGLDVNSSVAILGFNAPQWFISFLGGLFAGGVGCGIYTTNSVESCEYILKDSNSQIVVVENKAQLDKILALKSKFNFKAIIQYSDKIADDHAGLVMSWFDFIEYGNDVPDSALDERIKTLAPNKCASLIYTSGTTGAPKAAMISHDNISYLSRYLLFEVMKIPKFTERIVSYLPLSHIAAQFTDLYVPLATGTTIYFAQPDALKSSLVQTLTEAKPTLFFGVPRVWEKMQERITAVIKSTTGIKASIFEWARREATAQVNASFKGSGSSSLSYALAKRLVLNKVKQSLGLHEAKHIFSGAAPVRKDTLDFFISLGIPLCEVFGMSESTGPHIFGLFYANKVTSVGKVTRLNKSKIATPDEEGNGELCLLSRAVFMGYLNSLEKTKETIDDDGWLRTGDLGRIDKGGYLFITGRIKEIVITAGGENIAPVPIEDSVKVELPYLLSNCMVVGDKKKYLTLLVTLKSKINMDTLEPLDDLDDNCIAYLKQNGSNSTKVSQCIDHKDPIVYKLIETGIKKANDKSISRAAKVQKFEILHRDFSIFHGDLGPTMKLRRPIVAKSYANVIESMYKDDGGNE